MSRENTPYKLELTAQEFNELRSILHACDYFHQVGVMYNHVQHLERLFQEAERDANDWAMNRAREIVETYYSAIREINRDNKYKSNFYKLRLSIEERVLINPRARSFIEEHIPEGAVEWWVTPTYPIEEELQDPQSCAPFLDFRSTDSIRNLFNDLEPKKKLGFFNN